MVVSHSGVVSVGDSSAEKECAGHSVGMGELRFDRGFEAPGNRRRSLVTNSTITSRGNKR